MEPPRLLATQMPLVPFFTIFILEILPETFLRQCVASHASSFPSEPFWEALFETRLGAGLCLGHRDAIQHPAHLLGVDKCLTTSWVSVSGCS